MPIVTLLGLYAIIMIGDSIAIEIVFSRPGFGRLILGGIAQRDYVLLQSVLLVYVLSPSYQFCRRCPLVGGSIRASADRVSAWQRSDRALRTGPAGLTRMSGTVRSTILSARSAPSGLCCSCSRPRSARCSRLMIPSTQNILARFAGRAPAWLGADEYGRDILSRLLYAAALRSAIRWSVCSGSSPEVVLGVVASLSRRLSRPACSRDGNILFAFPTVVVGILVLVSLGPGSANVVVALAISFIPRFIRLARAEALSIMQRNFIEAARAAGASGLRIMARHILPNVIGTAVVSGALWTATALRAEATLSFLGLGVPLPWPSWGNLVADGMPNMFSNADLVLYPCLAIVFAVVSFNMLGDALRDYFDPRLVGR